MTGWIVFSIVAYIVMAVLWIALSVNEFNLARNDDDKEFWHRMVRRAWLWPVPFTVAVADLAKLAIKEIRKAWNNEH